MIWEIDESTRTVEGLDEHGRARPEYAASLGLVAAPRGRRVLATTIELAAILVLMLPALIVVVPALTGLTSPETAARWVAGPDAVVVLIVGLASCALTTAFIVVQVVLHGRRGVTLGKALTGIRSVNVRTLERPGFWRGGVVRYLVLVASTLVPLVGPLLVIALSPLFDPERRGRGWADLAAATWFVDVRDGLNPYDAKRMRIARKTAATDLNDERSALPSLATPAQTGEIPGVYVPVTRSRGGVVGAPRDDSREAEPDVPTAAAPAGASLVTSGPVDPASRVDSAPPSRSVVSASGPAPGPSAAAPWQPPELLGSRPATPAAAPPAPAPAQPAPAPQPPAPQTSAPQAPAPMAPAVAASAPASAPAPARRASSAASAPSAGASASLVLDDGREIAIAGAGVLVGRDPSPAAGETGFTMIAIDDPSRSVSKTHLAVTRHGDRLAVADRGSTNGSSIVRGGAERPLAPGESVPVEARDIIHFGDRTAVIRLG